MNKLIFGVLMSLSITLFGQNLPGTPFGVTGLAAVSTKLAFKSLSWDRNGTISLHCTQDKGAERTIGLTGINLQELPYQQFDTLDIVTFLQPDGPRRLISFLDSSGKLLGVIALNAGGRLKLLDSWTLSPGKILTHAKAPQRNDVEVILAFGSQLISAKTGEPLSLALKGQSWNLVIRSASIPGDSSNKLSAQKSQESPAFSVNYTVFLQTK